MDETNLLNRELLLNKELFKMEARESLLAFTLYTKPDYKANWHHKIMCDKLDLFARGKIKRLVLCMPPRHGKTELGSRRLPAFIFGINPNASIISTSYSFDLSSRINRDVQRVIDTQEYSELFPDTILSGKNVRTLAHGHYLRNNEIFEIVGHNGIYKSAGVGGGITGMGANICIIDDCLKDMAEARSKRIRDNIWDWYNSVLYTRLEKNGSILIILTRWHEGDLVGRLLEQTKINENADQWEVVSFEGIKETETQGDPRDLGQPLWPAKYDLKTMLKMKSSLGTKIWDALYQQRPSALEGTIFKRSWFKYYEELPECESYLQSWDCAFKDTKNSSYVVGQVWGRIGSNRYLIHQVRARMDFVATIKAIKNMSALYPYVTEKLIEDKANGSAVISTLKDKISGLIPIEPKGSKESRASAVSPQVEAGNVFLPKYASWLDDFLGEICAFPDAPNDDITDCTTQALFRMRSNKIDNASPLSMTRVSPWSSV